MVAGAADQCPCGTQTAAAIAATARCGDVGGIVVPVVAVAHLARTAMPAPIMRDYAKSLVEEIGHLRVPVIAGERPAVVEEDRLRVARTPVLEKHFHSLSITAVSQQFLTSKTKIQF